MMFHHRLGYTFSHGRCIAEWDFLQGEAGILTFVLNSPPSKVIFRVQGLDGCFPAFTLPYLEGLTPKAKSPLELSPGD